MICRFILWGIAGLVLAPVASSAAAQTVAAQPESANHIAPDTPALEQPARLEVKGVSLTDALAELTNRSGVVIAYSPSRLVSEAPVDCDCAELTVAEALERLLASTQYRYAEVDGHVVVVPRQISNPGPRGVRPPPRPVFVTISEVAPITRSTRHGPPARQTGTIAGRVTDSGAAQPIRLASVRIEATRRGTMTDSEGRYRLEDVPVGTHTVLASMLGYGSQSQRVAVTADEVTSADFALELSPFRMDEVVVTATGEQRRVELGHVVGRIDADAVVREVPVTRLSDLIGARVAGVQIIANSGFTGESPRIRIRGLGSFSRSRDPLLYVDGVRVESSTGALAGVYGISSGRFNDLNPSDIESIEVAKGPSAATLYGTDAANGVILIRTKRGQPGRARWNVYVEGGQLRPSTPFDKVDSYYSWGVNTTTGNPQRCLLVQIAAGACTQDSLTVFNPLTHPETTPIGTGTRSQLGAQVSGGGAQLTYFLSGDYEQETGYLRMPDIEIDRVRAERGGAELPNWQIRPNALERLRLRGSLVASIGDDADVHVSSGLLFHNTRIPGNSIFTNSYHRGAGYRDANDGWGSVGGRPGESFAIKAGEEVSRYTGSLTTNWRPRAWLTTRATVGTDLSSSYFDGLQRPGEGPPGAGRSGQRLNSRTNVAHYTIDLGISAATNLSISLSSRTSVGAQYNRRTELATVANATNLPPGSETVTGAAVATGDEAREESVVAGGYVEQMFGLSDRLFITGAVRVDGSSSFGRNFSAAVYPKTSASWLFSHEPFFPYIPFIDNLRLRLAYGQSGVQPGSTDALDLVSRFSFVVDGAATNAAALSRLGNPHLRPERQREIEVGFDLDLLDQRITIEGTYYNRVSTDALIMAPLATSVGLDSRWENLGSVRNWGYEAVITLQFLRSDRLSWEGALNGSVTHNRLKELGIPGLTSLGITSNLHREGFPLFGRWDFPILSYHDANGNQIIEPEEVQVGDTLVYFGPAHPPRQLTASTALAFLEGRLRLSTQFDYRGGHIGFNASAMNGCNFTQTCRAVNDAAAPLWDQARAVARIQHGSGAGYYEDASFIRWREVALAYQLPAALTARLRAADLTLTVSGRNLHLWTDYTGVDPEVNSTIGNALIEGNLDNPTAPQTRHWLLRLDARI